MSVPQIARDVLQRVFPTAKSVLDFDRLQQAISNISDAVAGIRTDGGNTTVGGPLVVEDLLTAEHLRLNETPTPAVITSTHTIPININGTVYRLLLST